MRKNTLNGMQAIRRRAVTVLKAATVAMALTFAGSLVGNTESASAQKRKSKYLLELGPVNICIFRCVPGNYCCVWVPRPK